ncbi:MAG: helix-turn-helix domain-containing protein [Clostridia bacterium]|nr:helix-turn-helix domain-containing protein [Clostridia bacterium]MBR6682161.1 helix-turn-helix domain-containing protein [Clostridia bacterium]
MFYDRELHFLVNVFKNSHIAVSFASYKERAENFFDMSYEKLAGYAVPEKVSVEQYLGSIEKNTMYKLSKGFGVYYIYLLLPEERISPIMIIGPYTTEQTTASRLLELGEKNGIPPKVQKIFEMKYEGVPYLPDASALTVMLDTFCELIFESPNFRTIEIQKDHSPAPLLLSNAHPSVDFDEVMVKMENIQRRYDYENELMKAVTLGHIHKIDHLFSSFSEQVFEKRVSDPLRNRKNYLIILNTLLRKAAEQGGVHPIYLDSLSSSFAFKTESFASVSEISNLMREMFKSYCRLVRTHSMKGYSPLVQKVITLIDSDLSADLTLSSIAERQKVSPGYLSTLFRKETGKTITEYIRDRRIQHAAHLLRSTHLQIQTVALHCGIVDVQYFSKIFKKQIGKTPREYREEIRT